MQLGLRTAGRVPGLALAALLLAGCGVSIPDTEVITEYKVLPCPPEIPDETKCPDWPTGSQTLRERLIIDKKRFLVWKTCASNYTLVIDEITECHRLAEEHSDD